MRITLARYQTAFLAQVRRLAARMSARHLQDADLTKDFSNLVSLDGVTPRDAWGTELRSEAVGWYTGNGRYYRIRSAGPDQQFDTADDLAVYIEVHSGNVSRRPSAGTIDLKIEHDRGPFNGRAEVAGSVVDASGAVIPAAKVEITPVSGGKTMNAVANASGQFALTSLPPGKYEVEISSAGFETASLEFSVQPRDRAVLSATLAVGSTSQTVEVINRGFGFADGAFAVAGGAVGGMAHGVAGMPMAQAAMGGPIPIDGRNLIEMRALDSVTTVNVSAGNSALSTEEQRRARRARPLLLPRGALHQSGDRYRRQWRCQYFYSPGRLHHHLAHGDDRLHRTRRVGQRHIEPQGLSGFLYRPRPACHPYSGRSRVDPRRRL